MRAQLGKKAPPRQLLAILAIRPYYRKLLRRRRRARRPPVAAGGTVSEGGCAQRWSCGIFGSLTNARVSNLVFFWKQSAPSAFSIRSKTSVKQKKTVKISFCCRIVPEKLSNAQAPTLPPMRHRNGGPRSSVISCQSDGAIVIKSTPNSGRH